MQVNPNKQASGTTHREKELPPGLLTPEMTNEAQHDNAELTKIRELLFGEQVRETEKKRSELEIRITRSIEQLRKDVFQQLDAVSNDLKKDIGRLTDKLHTEAHQRNEDVGAIHKKIDETNQSLTTLAEKSEAAQRALSERLATESQQLSEDIQKQHQAITKQLSEVTQELRDTKTDRKLLAQLLADMSSRLLNEPAQ